MVDLENDLQVAREDLLHQRDGPLLERLGQQSMVGIRDGAPREIPRAIPRKILLVDEDPHQLGHRERRVRVVELDRDLVGEVVDLPLAMAEAAQDVADRACH